MSGIIRMKIEIDLENGERISGELEYPNDTYGKFESEKFLTRILELAREAKQQADGDRDGGSR